MNKGKKAIAALVVLLATCVEVGSAANGNMGLNKMVGYAFLGLALILVASAFAYAFIFMRKLKKERKGEKEKDKVEEVIKILREAKRIKEEIEKRGENLTSEADITMAQIQFSVNGLKSSLVAGVSDIKTLAMFGMSLILFGIGITFAFGIAIISML